jgi:hypothetical protein
MADLGSERAPRTYNVQDLLERARKSLKVGELLASPSFDLHTSMTAMEIGDPKMDPAMRRVDQRSLSERVATGEAPLESLSESSLLATMDRLLQLEVAWHDRFMLSQTVYTCLYMMDLERYGTVFKCSWIGFWKRCMKELLLGFFSFDDCRTSAHRVLHAFCNAIHVTCSYLYELIYSAQVSYDEDASVLTFGISLGKGTEGDIVAAIDMLSSAIGETESHQLVNRLKLRLKILELLHVMTKACTGDDLERIVTLCEEGASILSDISYTCDDNVSKAVGFAPTLHYSAIGSAPLKDLVVQPMEDVGDSWKSFFDGLKDACSWIQQVKSWKDLRNGLDRFSSQDHPAFVRSLVYRLIVSPPQRPDGSWVHWTPSHSMIAKDIFQVSSVGTAFFEALQNLPELDLFMNQCVIAVQGWCHTKCLNLCRQRRRLRHNVIDWKNMIDHAYIAETTTDVGAWLSDQGFTWNQSIDSTMRNTERLAPLTCWVVQETIWTLIDHLLLGGVLDLYQNGEVASVYGYVSYLVDYMEKMAREYDMISMEKRLSVQHGAKKLLQGPHAIDLGRSQQQPPPGPLRNAWNRRKLSAFYGLAFGSIARASIALQDTCIFAKMKHEFNGEKEQYMQRFGFMESLGLPEFLSYQHYLQYTYSLYRIPLPKDEKALAHTPKVEKSRALDLLKESLEYMILCSTMLASVESLMPQECVATLQKTLSANRTALKLLVALASSSGKNNSISSDFHISWTFTKSICTPFDFSTSILSLPTLTLQRK